MMLTDIARWAMKALRIVEQVPLPCERKGLDKASGLGQCTKAFCMKQAHLSDCRSTSTMLWKDWRLVFWKTEEPPVGDVWWVATPPGATQKPNKMEAIPVVSPGAPDMERAASQQRPRLEFWERALGRSGSKQCCTRD